MNKKGVTWLAWVILVLIAGVFLLLAMRGVSLPIVDYFKEVTGLTKDATDNSQDFASKNFLWGSGNSNIINGDGKEEVPSEEDTTPEETDQEEVTVRYSFDNFKEEEFYSSFDSFLEQIDCDLSVRDEERAKVKTKIGELNQEREQKYPEYSGYFRLYEYDSDTDCFKLRWVSNEQNQG